MIKQYYEKLIEEIQKTINQDGDEKSDGEVVDEIQDLLNNHRELQEKENPPILGHIWKQATGNMGEIAHGFVQCTVCGRTCMAHVQDFIESPCKPYLGENNEKI